ncbi:MAG: signal peptidase II [bacterium]
MIGSLLEEGKFSFHRGSLKGTLNAFMITFAVLGLDQLTKMIVERWAPYPGYTVVVVPWFNVFRLSFIHNRGAAFGMLTGYRWLFVVVAVVVSAFFVWIIVTSRSIHDRFTGGLILGGALGNMIDRVFTQTGVVDFIDVGFYSYRWPAFNVADMALTVGMCWLIWYLSFEKKPEPIQTERSEEFTHEKEIQK